MSDGLVIAADTNGTLYTIDAATGTSRWTLSRGREGFAASPTLANHTVFIGSRSGEFLAVDLSTGRLLWHLDLPAPVRQTAAFQEDRLYFTAEDLRTHCVVAKTGQILWTSSQHHGQTVRDGYPVILRSGRRTLVAITTNPVVNMAQRIAQDRQVICRNAEVDDRDWRKLDAWTKSEKAVGSPELWAREQTAIGRHLSDNPEAQCLYLLDAATGRETAPPPVLWCAGCQGVATAPVPLADGQALVYHRSAYGHWSHGVAPLVALGVLNLDENRITPYQHAHVPQPPWNTFWGTADEAQTFQTVGQTLLIVHQSTLSGYDPTTRRLFPIHGERDSWGGFRNLPWARNEWNGPARGGVAVVEKRLYWQTGSRILCLASGESGPKAVPTTIEGKEVPTHAGPRPAPLSPPGSPRQIAPGRGRVIGSSLGSAVRRAGPGRLRILLRRQ